MEKNLKALIQEIKQFKIEIKEDLEVQRNHTVSKIKECINNFDNGTGWNI